MNSLTTKRKRGKPVVHPRIIDINTGIVYGTFTEAAEDIHGDRSSIRRVCDGIKSHCNGHIFRYVDENEFVKLPMK